MGTISSARAYSGLIGSGASTATNVSGVVTIGENQTPVSFSDADILYSLKITSTGASDVASINLASGVVTQDTGTPTILDGDGKDFEGATLSTAVRINAILALADSANTGTFISFSGTNTPLAGTAKPGGTVLTINEQTSPGTCNVTFTASGDVVTLTILGKSS